MVADQTTPTYFYLNYQILVLSKPSMSVPGGLGEKGTSYSARTLPKLLNGVFFTKIFYRKVALKNHINLFLKFKIVNNQLIMR